MGIKWTRLGRGGTTIARPRSNRLKSAIFSYPRTFLIYTLLISLFATQAAAQLSDSPETTRGELEQVTACEEGEKLFRAQQPDQAEPFLRQCLEQVGDQVQILVYLAVIAINGEHYRQAEEWAQRAVTAAPDSPDARYWYGRALLETDDKAGAKQQWEAGIALSTEHVGILEGLARLAVDEGATSKAYGLLVQMQRLGVDEAWSHRMLSELARQKGLWAASLRHWQDYLARHTADAEDMVVAGELAILAGDTDFAIAMCEQAVALEPSGAAYGALGEALFAAELHEEALDALRRAVELDPAQPRFRFNLANVLEIMGLPEEAETHFQRYIELEPSDPTGRLNFAIHLDKLGRFDAALEQIRATLALDPSLLGARVIEAQILEKQNRYAEALVLVDSLILADPENQEQLTAWREQLTVRLQQAEAASAAGQYYLLHIVLADSSAIPLVRLELAQGVEFAALATRFSVGPTAAQGGDIGWLQPDDMIEPLRSAILNLEPSEVSPVVESRGLYHIFKRIR
jgi:tetratricopeptide (TPR) repeat protein